MYTTLPSAAFICKTGKIRARKERTRISESNGKKGGWLAQSKLSAWNVRRAHTKRARRRARQVNKASWLLSNSHLSVASLLSELSLDVQVILELE